MVSLLPYDLGQNHQLPQIIAIFIGSLTGISDGLLFAWTSPSIPILLAENSTNITLQEASYFTVISSISMVITAPFFVVLIDVVGRKYSVLLVSVPQFLSWLLTGFATNVWMFYAARFMSGMGDAIFFATIPVYVCEIAEPKVRGSWGNLLAISIYLGIFLINVIGAYYDIVYTAMICGCLPILQVVLFAFMPESPFYLVMKHKDEEATKALRKLRWRSDVQEELMMLKKDVRRQMVSESGTLCELFSVVSNRKALIMCMGIRLAQQFSGLSAFEMYTQYLFQEAGGNVTEKDAAMIFSGILIFVVMLSSYLVERIGRKPLMLFSCLGCGITLTIETVYFVLRQFSNVNLSSYGWVPLTGMIAYIVVCATGIGILPTLILGEIFSAKIKGKANAIMNIITGACVLLVPKFFLSLTETLGLFAPFAVFSMCCYGGVIFSHFYVIETKGKTLEEIQQELGGVTNPEDDIFIPQNECRH